TILLPAAVDAVRDTYMALATPAVLADKSLQVAIRRFVFAGSRSLDTDRLVDLMTCAEALFIKRANQTTTAKGAPTPGSGSPTPHFGGRATGGFDAVDGGSADDCNGHGTHVAGTVGGAQYGVAKAVRLVAVRVLNCAGSGTTAQVVAGINWVTSHAIKPAVANMSLGGGISPSLDSAVNPSISSGLTYPIPARNSNANPCNTSPARVPAAITVGATDPT